MTHLFDDEPDVDRDTRAVPSEGTKFDEKKPPMGLLPWPALVEVAKVLDFGAKKYEKYNWLSGMAWSRMYDAALRHLTVWISGESKDSETGLSHLSHCACCILFLGTYEILGIGTDDRWRGKTITGQLPGPKGPSL